MSYIITSNVDVNYQNKAPTVQTEGLNRAYSYSNSMDNIVIPENITEQKLMPQQQL